MQLWVQAARLNLRIKEVGVPRVYLDPNRAFGGMLDNAEERLAYYRQIISAAERDESIKIAAPHPVRCHVGTYIPKGSCR